MNEFTFLDQSKNPYVISNTPAGNPTKKADSRAEFIAECVLAMEAGDVAKMRDLLEKCEGYPIMKAKLERKLDE